MPDGALLRNEYDVCDMLSNSKLDSSIVWRLLIVLVLHRASVVFQTLGTKEHNLSRWPVKLITNDTEQLVLP
jgi:hypothetical protein